MLGISFQARRIDARAHRLPPAPSTFFLVIIGRIDCDAGERDDTLIMKREM
ncbi:hypothetical protein M2175_007860 [Bradyrhizobium elkanii]|uniref:hypothetical protein n=1 Tax=Bradyrhizobium TaxID=374 RepID=UPI000A44A4AB|nr:MULTISPECIES: hypothetical protein [Bradyrhizobium]MCS3932829.1 hypothetical protein [Bradyrhizobium elkanii]MCS3973387.1 hypothetical protein [Bradyrhizobium japonicum]